MRLYLDLYSPASAQAGENASQYGLENHGLTHLRRVYWNLPTAALYEEAIFRSEGVIAHMGPLVVATGKHTARAAADKFIVRAARTRGSDRSSARSRFDELHGRRRRDLRSARSAHRADWAEVVGRVLAEFGHGAVRL